MICLFKLSLTIPIMMTKFEFLARALGLKVPHAPTSVKQWKNPVPAPLSTFIPCLNRVFIKFTTYPTSISLSYAL